MKIGQMKESKYLRREDLDGAAWRVTVLGFKRVNVAKEDEDAEHKWACRFKECERPMVMNQTNLELMAEIFGSEETNDWLGKPVTIYVDLNVKFGSKKVGGLRVRAPQSDDRPPPATPNDTDDDDSIPF